MHWILHPIASWILMPLIWLAFIVIVPTVTFLILPGLTTPHWCKSFVRVTLSFLLFDIGFLLIEHQLDPHIAIFSLFTLLFFMETVITTYVIIQSSIWPLHGTLKSLGFFLVSLGIVSFWYSITSCHPLFNTVITLFSLRPIHSQPIHPHLLWASVVLAIIGKGYLLLFFGIMINAFSTDPRPSADAPLPEWFWMLFVYSGIDHNLTNHVSTQKTRNALGDGHPWWERWWQKWQRCLFSIADPYFNQVRDDLNHSTYADAPFFLHPYLALAFYIDRYFSDVPDCSNSEQYSQFKKATIQQILVSRLTQQFDNDYRSLHNYGNAGHNSCPHTPQCPRTLSDCFNQAEELIRKHASR